MDKLGPYLLGPNDVNQGIYTGDARVLSEAIPDESVDLIFTDPVYQNIRDYQWLAETAARILKPNANCIVQSCPEHLVEHANVMIEHLDWVWLLAEHLGRMNSRLWKKRIFANYKPWLWLSKEARSGAWVRDWRYSNYDKRFHDWGDGANFPSCYVPFLCQENGLLLDPFCGGGLMPVVAKMFNRNWLAFEIDPKKAQDARRRVAEMQPPLFALEPEQLSFGAETENF